MHNDYKEYLHEISLKKHILLLDRIREIIKSSKAMYQEQELHKFYEAVSKTIIHDTCVAHVIPAKSIANKMSVAPCGFKILLNTVAINFPMAPPAL